MNNKRRWLYPLRGLAIFILFFLIRTLTSLSIHGLNFEKMGIYTLPSQIPYIISAVADLFIINSVINIFSTYDRPVFENFKARGTEQLSFTGELKAIVRSYEFIAETAVISAMTVIFSAFGGLSEAVRCYYGSAALTSAAARLLPMATLLPLFFIISLLCRYETHRYWKRLIDTGECERLDSKPRLVFKGVLIIVLYPFAFPYVPYLFFMLVTFFAMIAKLAKILTVVGFILAVALLVLLIIGIGRLRHRSLRKKFIAQLTEICKEDGKTLRLCTKEEALTLGYDLSLEMDGEVYDVRIIRATRRGTPLYFTSHTDAYFLHRIGTKNHHFQIERHFDYSFNSEGTKIVLIIKFPKRIFVSSDGATHRIVGGDRIWDYIIYDTRSFLGSADRDCLGRFNNTME